MVTGGAGYIGSHVVRELSAAGIPVVVYDNLCTGLRAFVPQEVAFVESDLLDTGAIRSALSEHSVTGVIHIAGFKFAGLSVEQPLHTYQQNVTAMMSLLEAMNAEGVQRIVFSSSSSVYGNAASGLVEEDHPFSPTSPYGESKVIGEWLLRNQGVATGLVHTSLRYFNVVGSGEPTLPDVSPYNLFSMVFAGLEENRKPVIFGDDYDTPDGTCIRDYIHVSDLAAAHVSAARRMDRGEPIEQAYNLGSGTGTSVAEMMASISRVTGVDFVPEIGRRRAGDPARVVASGVKAGRDIDWLMRFSLDEMISSAFEARANLPQS
jgi:UDP-glucose 4-epimerase